MRCAPVASASSVRSMFTFLPVCSSIHVSAPPSSPLYPWCHWQHLVRCRCPRVSRSRCAARGRRRRPSSTSRVTTDRSGARILDSLGLDIVWQTHVAGQSALDALGSPLPAETLAAVQSSNATLKGPTATPSGTGFRSVNVELRQKLHLYANYRPARSMPGVPSRYEDVDLIVVRENTEGLYSGLEHEVVPGVVESLRVVTESASERIAVLRSKRPAVKAASASPAFTKRTSSSSATGSFCALAGGSPSRSLISRSTRGAEALKPLSSLNIAIRN